MYYRRCRCNHDGDGLGCIVMLVLGLLALPLIGLYLMIQGDDESKTVGLLLLIVGIIIWIIMACGG